MIVDCKEKQYTKDYLCYEKQKINPFKMDKKYICLKEKKEKKKELGDSTLFFIFYFSLPIPFFIVD